MPAPAIAAIRMTTSKELRALNSMRRAIMESSRSLSFRPVPRRAIQSFHLAHIHAAHSGHVPHTGAEPALGVDQKVRARYDLVPGVQPFEDLEPPSELQGADRHFDRLEYLALLRFVPAILVPGGPPAGLDPEDKIALAGAEDGLGRH